MQLWNNRRLRQQVKHWMFFAIQGENKTFERLDKMSSEWGLN